MASFKLKKINDVTRSANFVERPTWEDLSSRIIQLYKIESNLVSVSYLDDDGDLVMIDSNEELDWVYKRYPSPPLKEYRFLVQDSTCLDGEGACCCHSDCPTYSCVTSPASITQSSSELSHLSTYSEQPISYCLFHTHCWWYHSIYSLLCNSDAIKRPHSPDDTDGAKRLKTDVVVGEYLPSSNYLPSFSI